MAFCGVIAARREPVYIPNSGMYAENGRFLQPEIIVLIVAFTFVFGCRWGVGVDYFHYLLSYQHGYIYSERIEYLFKGISTLFYRNGLHFAVFFSFWACVQITFIYLSLRKYRFVFPYIAFFLIFGSFYMSMMNVIRQQVAACIFLFSIKFIENKKIIPYYLCVIIAYLIHQSAIILVIAYPILRIKDDWFKKIPVQVVIYAICIFLSFYSSTITKWIEVPYQWFSSSFGYEQYGYSVLDIEKYNDRTQFGRNSGLGIYTNFIRNLPIIFLSNELKKYYKSSFFNMLYSLWFVCITFGLLFSSSIVLYRPFVYLMDTQFIVTAFFSYYCFKSKKPVLQVTAIIVMLVYLAMFLNIIAYGEINTSQFSFFWQN